MRVRRAVGVNVSFERRSMIDAGALLRAEIVFNESDQRVAMSADSQEEVLLDSQDLMVLATVGSVEFECASELARRCEVPLDVISQLLECGMLEEESEVSRVEGAAASWDLNALNFHLRGRWSGRGQNMDSPATVEEANGWIAGNESRFGAHIEQYGAPPSVSHRHPGSGVYVNLPDSEQATELATLMRGRKTTRLFDQERQLPISVFSHVMREAFGVHGLAQLADGMIVAKKNNPSAGSLHPVEVFPIIVGVEGLTPGWYHYRADKHSLEQVVPLLPEAARKLIDQISAGQTWFSTAHVVLVYTARYARTNWKYRNHQKAYKTVQMDVGHISQNVYLLCAEAGIGSFYTAACNDADIDSHLGLDGLEHGTIALGGFGIPLVDGKNFELNATPYSPGDRVPEA